MEQPQSYYDEMFCKSEFYHREHDEMGNYSTLWNQTLSVLKSYKVKSVLDIGCGMGQFGILCGKNEIKYKGIDFSLYAINYCVSKITGTQEYRQVDMNNYAFNDNVDAYILHEFLEHIENDIEILKKLKPGKLVVFTVPDFDDPAHVRWFDNWLQVERRYRDYFQSLSGFKITLHHYFAWGKTN